MKQAIINWINSRAEMNRKKACMHDYVFQTKIGVQDIYTKNISCQKLLCICSKCGYHKIIKTDI